MDVLSSFLIDKQICFIPDNYVPSDIENFMNLHQLEYFRRKLITWRKELINESNYTIEDLKNRSYPEHIELLDKASKENEQLFEIRSENRIRKLILKIDAALRKIENRTYGYCEVTGDPISIKRLMARPIATMSIEAQEYHEKQERLQIIQCAS